MKIVNKLLFLFAAVLFAYACNDDDISSPKGEPLTMTASPDSIVLLESQLEDIAVSFSWNKGIEYDPGYTVQYIFRLDMADHNFETAIPAEILSEGKFNRDFTVRELNELVTEKWGVHSGEDALLEARIVGKVIGPIFLYPEIAYAKIYVKTFAPASIPLYLVGSATSGGDALAAATQITETTNGRLYNWQGNLSEGEFKLIFSKQSLFPSYNQGSEMFKMVKVETASEEDKYFKVEKSGFYGMYVNASNMTLTYRRIPFEKVYLIGSATNKDWDLNNAIEMQSDVTIPGIMTATVDLKKGELKLPTQKDWGANTYRPMTQNGSIKDTQTQVYPGGDDLKWSVKADEAGKYKITLNMDNNTILFEKQ